MNVHYYFIFWLISFMSSAVGAICGIGGGVIIKPILDTFGVLSVSSISFLSGCTVLAMSCYSVLKEKVSGKLLIDIKIGTPIGIGAAIGGIVGKSIFQIVTNCFTNKETVGAAQAACLLIITIGTLIYTIKKEQINTHHITNTVGCIVIGIMLGIFSSFLGIGGGPINLVVLFYFFSMDTKTAAQNSIYIIFFSQITSLLNTIVTRTVPEFQIELLILMVMGGILGGAIGRRFNKKMKTQVVDKLFIFLMVIIILINIYNIYQFT